MFMYSDSDGSSTKGRLQSLFDPASANLHRTMIDAAPDCILLVGLDGTVLLMNKAARAAANLQPHESDERSWFSFAPPDKLEECQRNFAKAVNGEPARFALTTCVAEETVYWDIVFSPVRDPDGNVAFIMSIGRDITSNHVLDIALTQSAEREQLVTQEMQHRIKNLFSIVGVLITMAEREAKNAGTPQELGPILKAKMAALARSSEATYLRASRCPECVQGGDDTTVDVGTIVSAVLAPYASMVSVTGHSMQTSRRNITTLTLFLHELATNSVKYGALSQELGHVSVDWQQAGTDFELVWTETGGPEIADEPLGTGFGSTMIDRLIALAGGSITRQWPRKGLVTRLQLPG